MDVTKIKMNHAAVAGWRYCKKLDGSWETYRIFQKVKGL